MKASRISQFLDSFDGKRILVAGDPMLDEYVWGTVTRISPEAPVMVVEANEEADFRPGGAANVVHNVQALGAAASLVGIVGDDTYGSHLKQQLAAAGVEVEGIIVDESRPTSRKTRIIAHNQQVVRVDREKRQEVSPGVARRLIERLDAQIPACNAVLYSDYSKGVITADFVSRGVATARGRGLVVTSNPKPANILRFKGASVVTLNQSEAQAVAGASLDSDEQVSSAGLSLAGRLSVDAVVITRGSAGLCVCERGGKGTFIPATPIAVYDVAGAGDTVISCLTLALTSGADFIEAATLANWAAAAAVTKVGVATVTRQEILEMARHSAHHC